MPPKRKKIEDVSAKTDFPVIDSDQLTKEKYRPPSKNKHSIEIVKPDDIPWPTHLKELERVHRALNIVYTFCCTRKQLATTFENLKAAVEGHTQKELIVEDIAQIKFLVPKSIHFEYVDGEMLQVYVAGGGGNNSVRDEAYSMSSLGKQNVVGGVKEALLFEFVDGDLKRSVVKKLNEMEAPGFRRLRNEDLKMPTFSMPQMMKLITKRNDKFESAVNKFLNQCTAAGMDPVDRIKKQYYPYVPTKTMHTTLQETESSIPKKIPTERRSIAEIIEEIKQSDLYVDQIVENGHRVIDPQDAIYGDLTFLLSQHLVNALYSAHGVTQLYSHQAEAINNIYSGHNVIVSTSTSSGKSLIYQIPVLHELEQCRTTRAMFIFPTKALAQDQKRSLVEVLSYMTDVLWGIKVDTFDGDTPTDARRVIRDEASVIFTNPDILHLNILPNEKHWRIFLKNLKYVVVDELHVYNGLFGSNVAFIMRRLQRICSSMGNNSVCFISCSATIANPEEHMRTVFGIESLKLTAIDGSPSGRKEFLCWNTPFKDPKDPSSGRVDSTTESAKLFAQLILRGVKTIAFCRVRNVCELMIQAVRTELQHLEHGDVGGKVMAYRGGYTPEDRRRIEKEMFEGHLLGVVATNALELGVDIGSLDAVLIVNFPYSISNLRQQSGRAGRRNKDSLSVLIGGSFPIDQYYMSHPEEIFLKPNISLSIDLENLLILEGHIQCAAHEMPIEPTRDRQYFGEDLQSIASSRLVRDEAGFYHTHSRFKPYPPSHVAIRDTNDEPGYAVVDVTNNRNVVLEEVDPFRAIFTLYEGGIFLHQGRTYLVRTFSPESSLAQVEIVNVNWTTSPRDFTDVDPIETELIHIISNRSTKAFFGKIRITTVVFGFFKLDKRKRILDAVEMESPPLVRYAKGFWLDVPARALEILENAQMNAAAAIHAAEHAVMALLEGDGQGIKTECKAPEKEYMLKRESARKRPARLVFYDRNNADVSRKAFDFVKELLGRALDRVDNCRACISGCPECCCGARCGEGNVVVSKKGAAVVLKCLLGLEVKLGSLEGKDGRVIGEAERGWIAGRRTVVLASGVPGMKKDLVIKVEEEEAESRFINTVI